MAWCSAYFPYWDDESNVPDWVDAHSCRLFDHPDEVFRQAIQQLLLMINRCVKGEGFDYIGSTYCPNLPNELKRFDCYFLDTQNLTNFAWMESSQDDVQFMVEKIVEGSPQNNNAAWRVIGEGWSVDFGVLKSRHFIEFPYYGGIKGKTIPKGLRKTQGHGLNGVTIRGDAEKFYGDMAIFKLMGYGIGY